MDAWDMPFRDIVEPDELAMLTALLDDICHDAGIEPDSPERDEAAYLVMRFYWSGYRTADQLKAALDRAMGLQRYG
jgi:hypothetical protein